MTFVFTATDALDDYKALFLKLCAHTSDTLAGDAAFTAAVATMIGSTNARNFLFATVIDGDEAVENRLTAVAVSNVGEPSLYAMELLAVRALAHNERAKAMAFINAARGYVEPSGIADTISKALARESWE